MSSHFDVTDWNDYARGVVADDRRQAMDSHLSGGCVRCREIVRIQRDIVDAVAREEAYTPPEPLVRLARAIFPVSAPNPLASLPGLLARFLGDASQQPLPVGIRGARQANRHALYEAEGVTVDLRLEHDAVKQRAVLVGQILEHAESTDAPTIPAVLVQGTRVIAQTAINDFGEFRLEYPTGTGFTLQLPVAAGTRRLDVPLAPLTGGESTDEGTPRG